MKGFSVCLDYGHGGRDPGAVYKGRKESMDNLKLGRLVARKLREKGVLVDELRVGDEYISLAERANFSNRKDYDYFLSFHRNAFKPETASGVEVYIHPKGSKKAQLLGRDILNSLSGIGFRNRGLKTRSLYLLRTTKAPALLLEIGFIDSTRDNLLFDKELEKIGECISQEILRRAR